MSVRIASLLFAGVVGCSALAVAAQAPLSGSQIITVQGSRVGSSITLGGTVVPRKEVTLSAQLPGRVEYIAGTEGDRFKEGDLLVALGDDELLAQRRAAVAEYANADASARNAGVQYSRELIAPQSESPSTMPGMGMPSLFDQFFTRNMGSMVGKGKPGLERHADLYGIGTQMEQARNSMMRAQSSIQAIDAKLRDTRSVAPFDGVIVKKLVEEGDTVQPGMPLLGFADVDALQIKVEVPARHVAALNRGMVVPAKLDVSDVVVHVRVNQIFPMADVQRHTVTVKFDIPQGAPAAPGMYAEVRIQDPTAPARNLAVVPKSALVRRGSLHAVFVINNENRTELRLVRKGDEVDRDYVSILSGLKPNERIIANPQPGMASGWIPQP
ncbi:efflux RND transporter periplasmic adaptor subunit [Endothiovibrio diazotrophicus]